MGALPEGQRFGKHRQPAPEVRSGGPARVKWLRDIMEEAIDDDGPNAKTHRDAIARHLIEVARSWEVVVKGHNDDKPIEVASATASVAAAEVLFKHYLGRPPPAADEWRLALAEHIRKVARDQAELALGLLGNRVHTMSDDEKVAFFNRCAVDANGFLAAAEAELESRRGQAIEAQEQPTQIEAGPPAEQDATATHDAATTPPDTEPKP